MNEVKMAEKQNPAIPAAPETQPSDVREELNQTDVTHQGTQGPAAATGGASAKLGAVETEVTPMTPPMAGPGNLVDDTHKGQAADNMGVNPREELSEG